MLFIARGCADAKVVVLAGGEDTQGVEDIRMVVVAKGVRIYSGGSFSWWR